MAFLCQTCELNFEELHMDIYMQELLDERGVEDDRIRLYCPVCRGINHLNLRPYGIFYWNGKLYRWRSATTTLTSEGYEINISETLTIKIPEGQLEVISKETICYPAIPVFRQMDGTLTYPQWPVRKEYIDFIDTQRDAQPAVTQNRYHISLHLKRVEERVEVDLPLVPVRVGEPAQEENAIFEGVHLVLWPDVPYTKWRRYFLRFGCVGEQAQDLTRRVKVSAYAHRELQSERKEWIPIGVIAEDGVTRFECVESRPEWAAIEFESAVRGELEGGGIWAIPSADETYPTYMPTVAVDFGTSNTFIAWNDPNTQRTEPIPMESCDRFIIHGSDLPTVVDFPDTWPPRHGFGRRNALLPTEILTRKRLEELRVRSDEIAQWKPVRDYGIPSSGLDVRYPETEHIIAEFKWKDAIPDEAFRGQAADLQKHYLEFLVLFALAQLAHSQSIGQSVDLRFSYPLAFTQRQREDFNGILTEICQSVSAQTGISISSELPMDEARAAASSIGTLAADYSAFLYVDIGGGSSDIALEVVGENQNRRGYRYIVSFQYAGSGLVYAFSDGGCLRPDCNVTKFRRMIREIGQPIEILRRGTVFHPNKRNPIMAKTSYFYSYLREFLARLLAAHIITGEWAEDLNEEEKELILGNGYLVALYPLGNGWGFGELIDPQYARDVFSKRLADRVNDILQQAVDHDDSHQSWPQVSVRGANLPHEPKDAVAYGLLRGWDQGNPEREEWSFRTILGWTTRVGRTRRCEWFLPVTDRAGRPEQVREPLPENPILDCPEDEWPSFPRRLPTPHLLDPGLNQVRDLLRRECVESGSEREWFSKSPFHVLLEKLFKSKLKELV
ncbi:MAG: hypothetical protein D6723_16725 [Acidobacteria bacterium]|nr:MAG: hypothetical protein D6723_16725 [Acidobacteriota bacterium]